MAIPDQQARGLAAAVALRAVADTLEADATSRAAPAPMYYSKHTAPIEGRAFARACREIPTYRPGREVLVRADALHEWIERHHVAPRPTAAANDAAATAGATAPDPDTYEAFSASVRRSRTARGPA